MAKYPTYPIIIDELISISIGGLNKLKLLSKEYNCGVVKIGKYSIVTGKFIPYAIMDVTVILNEHNPHVEFEYTAAGNSFCYKVKLVPLNSNLGKGKVWFFICPKISKRCSKLHLHQNVFVHRTAIESGMYSKQIVSKTHRSAMAFSDKINRVRELQKALQKKHGQIRYKGMFTSKMRTLMALNKSLEWRT